MSFRLCSSHHEAKLLPDAQVVRVLPGFDGLTVHHAVGVGPGKRHGVAARRLASPRPLVGAVVGVADRYLLPFSDQCL
jgi:hypothetical protein